MKLFKIPRTDQNKTGEGVLKGILLISSSSHLQRNAAHTFKPTLVFHTVATIYPSVTPISAKLSPFISKAAVRDTYYRETLSLHTHPHSHSIIRSSMTTLILIAVKILVKSMHSSFRLTALLLREVQGQAS